MPPRKPKPKPCPPISPRAYGQVYHITEEELIDGCPEPLRSAALRAMARPDPLPRGRGRPRVDPDEPTVMYSIRLPAPLALALRQLDTDEIRKTLSRLTSKHPPVKKARKPRP